MKPVSKVNLMKSYLMLWRVGFDEELHDFSERIEDYCDVITVV